MLAALILLLDPVIVILLMLPLLLWAVLPAKLSALTLTLTVVLVSGALLLIVRKSRRGFGRELAASHAASGHHWVRHMPPAEFRARFDLFLRTHGWHILESAYDADPPRVETVAEKDRYRATFVCLPPGRKATTTDIERADALCRTWHAQARIVAASVRPTLGTPGMLRLRYDELARPDEVLAMLH